MVSLQRKVRHLFPNKGNFLGKNALPPPHSASFLGKRHRFTSFLLPLHQRKATHYGFIHHLLQRKLRPHLPPRGRDWCGHQRDIRDLRNEAAEEKTKRQARMKQQTPETIRTNSLRVPTLLLS
jgi:hypothetical protein